MTAQAGDTLISQADAKQPLRRLFRAQRKAIPRAQRLYDAARAARRADAFLLRHGARCVAVYLPHGSELDTWPLIGKLQRRGIKVLVPKLTPVAGRMNFVRLGKTHHTVRHAANRYGIAEPKRQRRIAARVIDVVLVPLLAVDKRGFRLGAGGGYYDRWFASHAAGRRPLRLGYAHLEQLSDQPLPHQAWDIRLHGLITPAGIRRFRNR